MGDNTAPLKVIVKGAGLLFSGMILSKFITYFYLVFVARYFGPENYGIFSLGMAVVNILVIFSLFGLPRGVVRYTAFYLAKKMHDEVKAVIKTSIKLSLAMSLLLFFLLLISSKYLSKSIFGKPELTDVLIILSLTVIAKPVFSLIIAAFEGFKKIDYKVYTEYFLFNLSNLFLVVVFGILGFGVSGIAASYTISTIIALMASFYLLEKKVYSVFSDRIKSVNIEKKLLKFSLPLFLSGFLSYLMSWSDTLLLGYFRTAIEVGIYNVVIPTAWFVFLIPNAMNVNFLPVITEQYIKDRTKFKETYNVVTRWAFALNFPVFLIIAIFSKDILELMFGDAYLPGYISLIILSFGFFIYSVSNTTYHVLNMLAITKFIFYISLVSALLNVLLNIILIPDYGIEGAAFASALSYMVMTSGLIYFCRRVAEVVPFNKEHIKPLLSGLISSSIVPITKNILPFTGIIQFIFLTLLFILLYVSLLVLFKGIEKEDREIIDAIMRKFHSLFNNF